jgi:hypothetical protein
VYVSRGFSEELLVSDSIGSRFYFTESDSPYAIVEMPQGKYQLMINEEQFDLELITSAKAEYVTVMLIAAILFIGTFFVAPSIVMKYFKNRRELQKTKLTYQSLDKRKY